MKKVGIVTIFNLNNYGNRLQNYAVNYVLKSLSKEPENIVKLNKVSIKAYLKINFGFLFGAKKEEVKRGKLFSKFTKMYGNTSYRYIKSKYDYIVCGSDQIWNPDIYDDFYFANFAEKNKRISYAASFGLPEIPSDKREKYKRYLSEMKAISVREDVGAKIVKELTKRDSEVLIDPTLMLDKKDWQRISEKPEFYNEKKYILTYFLGNINEKHREYIEYIAESQNYEIIDLNAEKPSKYWYLTGPSEFIWLIEHCELMCTDSFHGSVFSVLMDVPFIVFDRQGQHNNMGSRIDTLLETLQLSDRRFNNQTIDMILEKEYFHIPNILCRERSKAINFLKNAMVK